MTAGGSQMDILPIPQISSYSSYTLDDCIEQANTDLRYSTATHVTDMDVQFAEDEDGNIVYCLLIAAIYTE